MSWQRVAAALVVAVVGSVVGWTLADMFSTGRQGIFGPVVTRGDSAHGFVRWFYRIGFCGIALMVSVTILVGS